MIDPRKIRLRRVKGDVDGGACEMMIAEVVLTGAHGWRLGEGVDEEVVVREASNWARHAILHNVYGEVHTELLMARAEAEAALGSGDPLVGHLECLAKLVSPMRLAQMEDMDE